MWPSLLIAVVLTSDTFIHTSINPNRKIPAFTDPNSPDGKSLNIWESGSCLMYLAEKYQVLLPASGNLRYETINWLFWGSASLSPQVKQFGFYFHYCTEDLPHCRARYTNEVLRLVQVLEQQLANHKKHWIVGDLFTIADISIWPMIYALHEFYGNAKQAVFKDFEPFPCTEAWFNRCLNRQASQRSLQVATFLQ